MINKFAACFRFIVLVTAVTCLTTKAQAQHVLGVTLQDYHRRGALVVGTSKDSASQRMICPNCSQYHQIRPGVNVITAINGQTVSNTAEAKRAISSSPLNIEITILNVERESERTYKTTLAVARSGLAAKRRGRSIQRGSGSSSTIPIIDGNEWLNQAGINSDSSDSNSSHSGGIDNWKMHNWIEQRNKNLGWSTRPDLSPVTW